MPPLLSEAIQGMTMPGLGDYDPFQLYVLTLECNLSLTVKSISIRVNTLNTL